MEKSIVQVDISVLNKEIAALESELQIKIAMRNYILSFVKPTAAKTNSAPIKTAPVKQQPTQTTAPKKQAAKPAAKQQPVKKAATKQQPTPSTQPLGLTEFILDYLRKHPKSGSKAITDSFAAAWNKKFDEVKYNVSNTLSRLLKEKKLKKSDATEGPGYLWSLK